MTTIILQSLYFMLPAYLGNAAPVLFSWIPLGNFPLDHGKTWHGKRILGDHKTYRGLISGVALAILTVFLQKYLMDRAPIFRQISLLSYDAFSNAKLAGLGALFGIGALGGDAVKSFFKRRRGIAPGKNWIPFDQLDLVVGSLLAVSIVYTPPAAHLALIIVITPFLHVLANLLRYLTDL